MRWKTYMRQARPYYCGTVPSCIYFNSKYPCAPTSITKRWTDQPLDFVEVFSGSNFQFVWWQILRFSLQELVRSIIMEVFCVFGKVNISGLRWGSTIQDDKTILFLESDIAVQSGAKCKRSVWGFLIVFLS